MTRVFTAADFDYELPPGLIAQRPAAERPASRLLVLHRATGLIEHRSFREFPSLLRPGDALVINRSRVIPARLNATRHNGRPAEILLVHRNSDGSWDAMVHPGGKLKPGRVVTFGTEASAEIVGMTSGGLRRVRFAGLTAEEVMRRYGSVPLPPYITRAADAEDRERYQTVFADRDGSVAAPTAGLHFTPDVLDDVRSRGIRVADVTLHVGPGTFKPVDVDDPSKHVMHEEWFDVGAAAAETVNVSRAAGGRAFAVGTTVARTLETAAIGGILRPATGWTGIFIYPPYAFQVVGGLLTNFHLPRSTLLMLVAAFAGYEATMAAYRAAVEARYRFYSYGDAMAVV